MFVVFPRVRTRISIFAIPAAVVMLWLDGALAFLLLVISALVHELGHLLAMKRCGYSARRIDVLPMGAVIVCPEGIPNRHEAIIAASGPLASLACAVLSSVWYMLDGTALALYAIVINTVLGVFNLIPISKLDGGKALFCFLADRCGNKKETAERFCSAVSTVAKILFTAFSVACIVLSGFNFGVAVLALALTIQIIAD